jgi:hypothetical protein
MTGAAPSDPKVAGEPIDVTWIDALALGDLWTTAHRTELWRDRRPLQSPDADAARAVIELGRRMEPLFRGSACRDYLALLVREVEEDATRAAAGGSIYTWRKAGGRRSFNSPPVGKAHRLRTSWGLGEFLLDRR